MSEQKSTYRTLKQGETYASIDPKVEGEKITVEFTVKPDKDSPLRYILGMSFDFTDVTHDELLHLASRRLIVDQQNIWKAAMAKRNAHCDDWDGRNISVRAELDKERKAPDRTLTPAKMQAAIAASDMKQDDIAAMIALLQSKLAAS